MQTLHRSKIMEPSSTGIGGWAAVKLALAFGVPAALAAIIGMVIMPPRTAREFVARTVCTVFSSFIFGPMLAIAVISWRPSLIDAAHWVAKRSGTGEEGLLAMFYVLGPCMLLAGLPAWWVLGAYMRWMASMREKGFLVWVAEARAKLFGLRGGSAE
ncbi:phage-related putative membrane protein [Bordetella bronchiseptica RB50]|uniref:Phage-related putative membrane protein n=2 Tax=Bordetella bronchiseptica TaxID=518 RepID=A0A0H3LQ93_BORBR|nr:phage-related putative membrane protein [Bordetella bronchiseptica RB50]